MRAGNEIRIMALVSVALSLPAACGQTSSVLRDDCIAGPASGLYEVTSRQCENLLGETDYCPLTQYLEVAPSQLFDVADGPRVLVFWYAEERESSNYANEVRVLRGQCERGERYILERDALGDAWLKLERGQPVEYQFVGYTDRTPHQQTFKMRLFLRPVTRAPQLGQRLLIERD